MKKLNLQLPSNVTRAISKATMQLKKHSPEILVAAGVAGTVASAVMACKATLKVNEVVEEAKDNLDMIHEAAEKGRTNAGKEYTLEDAKQETAVVYIQTGVKLVKLYAPAVALGVLSIAGIVKSNDILRKRNIALAAAYTAVDKGFKEYRGRVVERFGKDLDRELRYNLKAKEVEETVVHEDGTEQKVKKTVHVTDPNNFSEFARVFEPGSEGWDENPEYSLKFLKSQQAWANNKLKAQGYLFLNEVYDMLGIPRTSAGQIVGWIYDEKNPIGDNFVDFGIYDPSNQKACDFINGYEKNIILDFNVDGVIWELLQ